MKRVLVLVGLAAMSVGCAVDANDPVTQFPERDPSAHTGAQTTTTKSGDLDQTPAVDPTDLDSKTIGTKMDDYDLGAWQVYNVPIPGK